MGHPARAPFASFADEGVTSLLLAGGNRFAPGNLRRARHGTPLVAPRAGADWVFGSRVACAGLRMVRALAITTGGPTQDFTVAGLETPKAAIVIVNGTNSLTGAFPSTIVDCRRISIGFTDGSYSGGTCASAQDAQADSVTRSVGFSSDLVRLLNPAGSAFNAVATGSLIPGGVRLNWTTMPVSAFVVDVVLVYGEHARVKAGAATPGSGNVGPLLTDVGFRPKVLWTLSGGLGSGVIDANWVLDFGFSIDSVFTSRSMMTRDQDAAATTLVATRGFTDGTLTQVWTEGSPLDTEGASTYLDRFHDQGFRLGTSGGLDGNDVGAPVHYLAVDFGDKEFSLTDQATATSAATVAYFGSGEIPGSAMVFGTRRGAGNWAGKDKTSRSAVLGYGFFSQPEQQCSTGFSQDAAATSNTGSIDKASAYLTCTDTGGSETEALFATFDQDGFSLDWLAAALSGLAFVALTVERDLLAAQGDQSMPRMVGAGTAEEQFLATGTPNLPHPLVSAAAAQEIFLAAGAPNLPRMVGSGTAEEQFVASAAATLPHSLTSTGTAETQFVATGDCTLPHPLTCTGTAEEQFVATGAALLPRLQGSGAAEEHFLATGDCLLPRLQSSGTAEEVFLSTGDCTLPHPLTCTGLANVPTVGSGDCTLPHPLACAGTAEEVFLAAGDCALPRLTCQGTAETFFGGSGDCLLPMLQGECAAEEHFVAAGDPLLPRLLAEALAEEQFLLAGDPLLPGLTMAGTAEEMFLLAGDCTLPHPLTCVGIDIELSCPDLLDAGWAQESLEGGAEDVLDELPAGSSTADRLGAQADAANALGAGWGARDALAAAWAAEDLAAGEEDAADLLGGGDLDVDLLEASLAATDALGGSLDLADGLGAGYAAVTDLRATTC